MQHFPVIQNPSGDKGLPRNVVDGLINSALVSAKQHQYVDGLLTGGSEGGKKASKEPIKAVGSYVGAPVIPRGEKIPAYNPKTKSKGGMIYPVGQS